MRYIIITLLLSLSLYGENSDLNRSGTVEEIVHPDPFNAGSGCTVDLISLLQEGYRYYPTIRASRALLRGAEAQVESAKWNYFPTPSLDISQRAERRGVTLQLDQPLWTGGKLDARSDYAASQEEEARFTLDEKGYSLAEKLIGAVQEYLQAKGEAQGFSEGKEQLEELSRMLERRIAAGVSSIADRELLHSRIAQIESDLTVARTRHRMARSQLELLIGRPLRCAIRYDEAEILQREMTPEAMQQALFQTHPSLKKLASQIETSLAEKRSADAAVMPNLSLRAEYQEGSLYTDNAGSDTLLYVALSFSPGAGLSSLSEMERATYKIQQTREELRVKEEELKEALVLSYADYRASRDRLGSMQRTIDASRKVLASYTRLFIAGKRQWLDLVNTSRELTQSSVSLAAVKALLVGSAYRLALQTGQIALDMEEEQ